MFRRALHLARCPTPTYLLLTTLLSITPRSAWATLVLLCATWTGCASPHGDALPPWLLRGSDTRPSLYEELWPGDTFDVKFRKTPELDSTVTVGPDGYVQLPLVGKIRASGRTPSDLEVDIERLCQAEIKDPDASVMMTGFDGRAVHVGGEVKDPGRFVLTGPTTPLEALIQAGGALDTAAMESVLLVRTFENGGRRVFALNLEATINGRDQTGHLRLIPSDLLLVPRSGIANVNIWVDQYIRKNLPFNILVRPDFGVIN